MADHGNMDIKQHKGTYDSMTVLFKWGTVFCAALGLTVVLLIAS